MQSHQQRVLQSLRRVQAWCAANPELVPAPEGPPAAWSPLTRQLDVLNSVVGQLTSAGSDQKVHATRTTLGATDEKQLRSTLRADLRAVTQVAQALRTTVPGIGTLTQPRVGISTESFLKAADALRTRVSTYETVLVEHGLAQDFVAQLGNAINGLKVSIDGRGLARANQVSARKQVEVSTSLGRQYISIMDAALTRALRSDSAKLAEWRNAKRVTLKGVRSGTSSLAIQPSTPVPTSVPVTQLQAVPGSTSGPDAKAAHAA
jgi:hypothetical protein